MKSANQIQIDLSKAKEEVKTLRDEISRLEQLNKKNEQKKSVQEKELTQERSRTDNLKAKLEVAEMNLSELTKKYDESRRKAGEWEKEDIKAMTRSKVFEKESSLQPAEKITKNCVSNQNAEASKNIKFPESIIRLEKRINDTISTLDEFFQDITN